MGVPPEIDPLSRTIALLKPRVLAWRVIEAHGAWAISLPANPVISFGQVIAGNPTIAIGNAHTASLSPGDLAFLGTTEPWVIETGPHPRPIDFMTAIAEPARLLQTNDPSPVVTRFVAGAFVLEAPNTALVADLIPPLLPVLHNDVAAERLGTLLRLVGEESTADRPGRSLILDRLIEIILVETLRTRPDALPDHAQRLLMALDDQKLARALQVIHGEASPPWTVERLARYAGMSRSAFADRFARTLGMSPIRYAAQWRIHQARSMLASRDMSIAQIAQQAGFQSVSAFSTAFSRSTGLSPTAYARSLRMAH
ncbi:AraC family transcriptional regulator [Nguyenibacter vanlangensis]|uniref:AraC family transcriptional regulator n=1 Tax=Nguyenibacter vanlangensis TaxID=1216886 RepID=A0ABZ3D0Z6_9PROT